MTESSTCPECGGTGKFTESDDELGVSYEVYCDCEAGQREYNKSEGVEFPDVA